MCQDAECIMVGTVMMLYFLRGKVRIGKNRGKRLGFPTINLRLTQKIPEGIYASETKIDGEIYKSVSFIGAARTFGETEVLAETYIINFDADIYGNWVSIRFLRKIRDNIKFQSEAKLVARIKKDIREAWS